MVDDGARLLYDLLGQKGSKSHEWQFGFAGLKPFIINRESSGVGRRGQVLWLCADHWQLLSEYREDGNAERLRLAAQSFRHSLSDKPDRGK